MKSIKLGDVSITQIPEWEGLGLPPEDMFPGIDPGEWHADAHWLDPEHWSQSENRVHIVSESWLLNSAGRTILIDTGVGNFKDRPGFPLFHQFDGPYLERLAACGIKPEDVDLVVCTHLHVDHVGWNTRLINGEWVPSFPNARYLISEPDLKYWGPNYTLTRPGELVNTGMFEDSVQPLLNERLVDTWDDTYRIDENLTLDLAPGHTPGNATITLRSGSDRAVFVGDMIHSPWQVAHSHVNSCFCEDPKPAIASRQRVLGWAADNNALVLPGHFAGGNAVEIERVPGASFAIKKWAGWS